MASFPVGEQGVACHAFVNLKEAGVACGPSTHRRGVACVSVNPSERGVAYGPVSLRERGVAYVCQSY